MAAWCAQRSSSEIVDELGEAGYPSGTVSSRPGSSVAAPSISRHVYQKVTHPLVATSYTSHTRCDFLKGRNSSQEAGPVLGEHNVSLFEGLLGLDSEAIGALAARGVISDRLIS